MAWPKRERGIGLSMLQHSARPQRKSSSRLGTQRSPLDAAGIGGRCSGRPVSTIFQPVATTPTTPVRRVLYAGESHIIFDESCVRLLVRMGLLTVAHSKQVY